jgi:hypothetical protein
VAQSTISALASADVADAEEPEVDDRRGVTAAALEEDDEQGGGGDERRQRAHVAPAPRRSLHDPQGQRPQCHRDDQCSSEVGKPAPSRHSALDQRLAREVVGERADRQVGHEGEAPVRRAHKHAPERRSHPGGKRRRRRPHRHRVTASLLGERLQHQTERAGHEHGGTGGLNDPEEDQESWRRGERAGPRGDGEDHQPDPKYAPSPDQVRDPPGADHERREHDVVGVQNPGEP